MTSPQRFADQVAIVTGGASGIGLAAAIRMAQEGATVVVLDLSTDPAEPVPDDVTSKIRFVRHDVSDEAAWREVVSSVLAEHGRIDVLVNNAGLVGSYDNIVDIALEDYHRIVAINQTGVFLGIRCVVPAMTEAGAGAIVNTSSIWGLVGAAGVSAYQASKGAVTVITRNAAASFAKAGIRCNSVHPGLIETPLTAPQDPAISQGLVDATPLGRAGTAAEVAAAITFLASTDASYITGAALVVDGGFTTV